MIQFKILWLGFFLGAFTLQAQITEEQKSMSMGIENALILALPNTDTRFTEKQWKKFMKEYDGKTKRLRKYDEYFTDDAERTSINGSNTVDIYIRVEALGEDAYLNVWFDLGGAFLNSQDHPNAYIEAEKLLLRFGLEVARESTKLALEEEEDTLKDLESDLRKLQRNNDRFYREIEKARALIKKMEGNIVENEEEQEQKRKEIDLQRKIVGQVQQKLGEL